MVAPLVNVMAAQKKMSNSNMVIFNFILQGFIFSERKKAEEAEKASHFELMRNGCCKECMKAFSVSGKVLF